MNQGGIYGYPVVDTRVICDDGKFHTVDSSEASFEMAGALGFALAFEQAAPLVLEPIDRVEVSCPGAVPGRRARRSQFPAGPGAVELE